jgi:hypothetical protein
MIVDEIQKSIQDELDLNDDLIDLSLDEFIAYMVIVLHYYDIDLVREEAEHYHNYLRMEKNNE